MPSADPAVIAGSAPGSAARSVVVISTRPSRGGASPGSAVSPSPRRRRGRSPSWTVSRRPSAASSVAALPRSTGAGCWALADVATATSVSQTTTVSWRTDAAAPTLPRAGNATCRIGMSTCASLRARMAAGGNRDALRIKTSDTRPWLTARNCPWQRVDWRPASVALGGRLCFNGRSFRVSPSAGRRSAASHTPRDHP